MRIFPTVNLSTRRALNALNRQFYAAVAEDFDTTRGRPWLGWLRLAEIYPQFGAIKSILDIGCGNGRFGVFAAQQAQLTRYVGVDSDAALLDRARENLAPYMQMTVTLREWDIVEAGLPAFDPPLFDCVALFGVLHHIAGNQQRVELIRALAGQVAAGGILAFTTWRFYEYERFRSRIVPWSALPEIGAVEAGDYLLDWRRGAHALRYCHYVDDAEEAQLIAASGLSVLARYRADGFNNAVNSYVVLARQG